MLFYLSWVAKRIRDSFFVLLHNILTSRGRSFKEALYAQFITQIASKYLKNADSTPSAPHPIERHTHSP